MRQRMEIQDGKNGEPLTHLPGNSHPILAQLVADRYVSASRSDPASAAAAETVRGRNVVSNTVPGSA